MPEYVCAIYRDEGTHITLLRYFTQPSAGTRGYEKYSQIAKSYILLSIVNELSNAKVSVSIDVSSIISAIY